MISNAKASFSRKKKKIYMTPGKPLKLLKIAFDKAKIFQEKTRKFLTFWIHL